VGFDQRIAQSRLAFVAALRQGDALTASSLYCSDARLLAPSAELFEGRDAIAAFWNAGVEAGIRDVEIQELTAERDEGVVWEIGNYALRLDSAEGGSVVDRGKYVIVHRREPDGSWLRAVEMFNPETTPAKSALNRTEETQ